MFALVKGTALLHMGKRRDLDPERPDRRKRQDARTDSERAAGCRYPWDHSNPILKGKWHPPSVKWTLFAMNVETTSVPELLENPDFGFPWRLNRLKSARQLQRVPLQLIRRLAVGGFPLSQQFRINIDIDNAFNVSIHWQP